MSNRHRANPLLPLPCSGSLAVERGRQPPRRPPPDADARELVPAPLTSSWYLMNPLTLHARTQHTFSPASSISRSRGPAAPRSRSAAVEPESLNLGFSYLQITPTDPTLRPRVPPLYKIRSSAQLVTVSTHAQFDPGIEFPIRRFKPTLFPFLPRHGLVGPWDPPVILMARLHPDEKSFSDPDLNYL